MSFGQEEEELDWGDAVDVVSLGDEDEIPCIAVVEENMDEETTPLHSGQEEDFESTAMSAKSPPATSILPHRRSRETIKASSMSRAYPRTHSPGAGDDLPRYWEVRRTETVIYYYHTEHRCSQLKRPTRDDARLDKFHWTGDAPPSGSDRSQSARNSSSGPAEWPERSAPDHQHRSSARDKSPPRRASPTPRQRSPKPPRQRSSSFQQSAPHTDADVDISSNPHDNRNGRSRDSGWEQRGRPNARERDVGRGNGRVDHYSPPPETGDTPRRGSRHRSLSPPRKAAAMRSDAMMISQHTRRSISPRDREDARDYDRPPFDRMPSDSRYGRDYPIDLRRGDGEYQDSREGHFRTNNGRVPNQYPPGPEPVPPHPRDSASFSSHPEDAGYPTAPPGKFRDGRFVGRPENRRAQSSRSSNIRSSRVDPQENDPRLSPVALRNEAPLQSRHEFIPPRDGTSSHRRTRNGDIRGRMLPEDRVLPPDDGPMDHGLISPPHAEQDLNPDIRQEGHIRRHGHRRSVSGEEYMARHSLSPPATRERRLPNLSPPRHSYSARPHDFSPQDVAEPREPDFRLRDREPERYPPKERRDQHESYPRGLRQDDPMPHIYQGPSVPHTRRIALRDSETLAPGRIYPPTESQGPPSPPVREAYPRQYVRDDQFADRPPRGWDREAEGPTPQEETHHVGRKAQPNSRRVQRDVVSDTEYIEALDEHRSRRRGGSRFEKLEAEGRPNYKRRGTRDDVQPYEPDDRQWTPRDAPHPPPAQMEVDPPLVHPPEKELSGWADFRRRRDRSQERREPYRSRAGLRDSWHPAHEEGQGMEGEVVEGGKRQRVEGGTRMTQSFNHREEDLPRKVPQHSPSQRPIIHSPNTSFSKLPPPALVVSPAVDFHAAVTRAKDVANQLSLANPQNKPRPKSRFDQPSDPTTATEHEINRGLLVPNASSGTFGAANTSETVVSSEINEHSSPEELNDGRQGSEGSHSSHIVSRMDEASLRDNVYPQRHTGRHRDPRADPAPERGRPDLVIPIGPEMTTPDEVLAACERGVTPKRSPSAILPPHTSTSSTTRTFRNAGDRSFTRLPQAATVPEGLPPRPPTPKEFARSTRGRGQTVGQVRSPSGQGPSFIAVTDADTADAATDNETDPSPATGFSFRQASANSPRKYSLLDRMTDPTSGAPPHSSSKRSGQQWQWSPTTKANCLLLEADQEPHSLARLFNHIDTSKCSEAYLLY
ncbi:hypothetical protein OPQ81_001067 [Rhizoctonia solani]|nr:hypothetical protein OPQ81_001067 [Rhizoctonia solani]